MARPSSIIGNRTCSLRRTSNGREEGREHEEHEDAVHEAHPGVDDQHRLAGDKGGQQQGRDPLPEVVPAEHRREGNHGATEQGRHDPPPDGRVAHEGDAGRDDELAQRRVQIEERGSVQVALGRKRGSRSHPRQAGAGSPTGTAWQTTPIASAKTPMKTSA